MRRVLPAAVAALALVATALPAAALQPVSSTTLARSAMVDPPRIKTDFLLGASAFGSSVTGGDLPADSGDTSVSIIGCQRYVGKTKSNFINSTAIPGLGTLEGIRTRIWTDKVGQKVSSNAVHSIAAVTLADNQFGKLVITGIESRSQSFHNGSKFGARVDNSVARIRFTPVGGGPAQTLDVPTPNRPVTIPGLFRITFGKAFKEVDGDGARTVGNALRITLFPSDTRIVLARTRTRIERTLRTGLFNGFGAGLQVKVLGDISAVGPNAYQDMPCMGTDGEVLSNTLASIDLDPVGTTGAAVGAAKSTRGRRTATGITAGSVADVSLLNGALEITLARGVATVRRLRDGSLTRSAAGSTVGEITFNDQPQSLDALGELEIPDVARLQAKVVERQADGLRVVGLRVTLLGGALSVIDLGVAQSGIRPRPGG